MSKLEPNGIYNAMLRYSFTNISEEPFTSHWDSQPITVKPNQTIELPQHLAIKFTNELIDKIMISDVKIVESEYYKNNPNALPNTYRAQSSLGVPAVREEWADKIMKELELDEESPQLQAMRIQIRAELQDDLNKEVTKEPVDVAVPKSLEEFAALKTDGEKPAAKAPLQAKTIDTGETTKPQSPAGQ